MRASDAVKAGGILVGSPRLPGFISGRRLVADVTPRLGWDTYLILTAMVGVVAWSVREADWVETPGLLWLVVWSTFVGQALANVRQPWPRLHLAGLAMGAVAVTWQASSLVAGLPLLDQARETWSRMSDWYSQAVSGGISTDLLPFTVGLLTLTWLLGYLSAWFLFRRSNVWVPIVLSGMALLTNLSYLPESFGSRFFVFVFLAILLVLRVSVSQRQEKWRAGRLVFGSTSGRGAVVSAALLSAAMLAIAAALPLRVYVSGTAVDVWNVGRTPIASVEGEFVRLFSGIESRKGIIGRFFGKALPFQGRVAFKEGPVLWASTQNPTYWVSRTYSEYTPQGWITGETEEMRVGPGELPPPSQESANRDLVVHNIEVSHDTINMFAGGQLDIISRDAVLETLKPMEFEIDLLDSAGDHEFPTSIQDLAERLRNDRAADPTRYTLRDLLRTVPRDLVLISPTPDLEDTGGGPLEKVTLQRKAPAARDVVAWRFADVILASESYTMGAYVSNASELDLRMAGPAYDGFIEDHYLQLPSSLPQRVRDLAAELTRRSPTPVDKALAIQEYLRSDAFEYSKKIGKPPAEQDAVDRFLFETQEGYSDYFASSMAVLLRSVGVPARLAAGYAPGAEDEETGRLMVEGKDSHGWTQVYFPGHGWIDFEPTPRWEAPELEVSQVTDFELLTPPEAEGEFIPDLPYECYFPEMFTSDVMYTTMCRDAGIMAASAAEDLLEAASWRPSSIAAPLATAVAAIAAVASLAMYLAWTKGLGNSGPAEKAYTRMNRLGTLAGVRRRPDQTPIEYAYALGGVIPEATAEADSVAAAYSAGRYGRGGLSEPDLLRMGEAWRSIRNRLFKRVVGRLIPLVGR